MDDVTDVVFREILTKTHPPDVFFTEFANCDALCSEGRESQIGRLKYTEKQRPIVAQIWGNNPETFHETAKLVKKLGFDGVDINMGCPQKTVVKNGAGAALINTPELAKEIIDAVRKGAKGLPVSVKTRVGFKKIQTEEWLGFLLEQGLAALTIHGRTQKEMSKVPVHWDEIGKAVKLRDKISPETLIVGNGDVNSYGEAVGVSKKYGLDGVMIGRGVFSNLWVFDEDASEHSVKEHVDLLGEHVAFFDKTWGNRKKYHVFKKFFKVYVRDFSGAAELREKLMKTSNTKEALELLESFSFK
jgi:tRNA-dihydrouridine synthase